jgi:hypothetical protein
MPAFSRSNLRTLRVVGVDREHDRRLGPTIRPWCYYRGVRAVSLDVYPPRSRGIRRHADARCCDCCGLRRFAPSLARSQCVTIFRPVFCFCCRRLPYRLYRVRDAPQCFVPAQTPARASKDSRLCVGMHCGGQRCLELTRCCIDHSKTDHQSKTASPKCR